MAGQFNAIHPWHTNIGQHDIDRMFAQKSQRLQTVARFAHHFAGQLNGNITEQRAQAVAGQRLVIDQQDFQRVFWRHGRTMRTS